MQRIGKNLILAMFGLMLAGGVGAVAADPAQPEATAADRLADVDPDELREAVERDEFLTDDEESLALATVNYLATVDVVEIHPEASLEGVSRLSVTLKEIHWATDSYWSIGEELAFTSPTEGTSLELLIDDVWQYELGDGQVIVGVATETRPRPDLDGYIQLAQSADRKLLPVKAQGQQQRLVKFIERAGESSGNRANGKAKGRPGLQNDVLIELIEEAHGWINEVNTTDEDASPAGVLAAEAEAVSEADAWAAQDPDYRQFPAALDEIEGIERAVRNGLVEGEVAVRSSVDPDAKYFALRFRGKGLLGPFNVDSAIDMASLSGVMPRNGTVEVLAWSDESVEPGQERSLGRVKIPNQWNPDTTVLVIQSSGGKKLEAVAEPRDEFELEVNERLDATDPGPRSELDE